MSAASDYMNRFLNVKWTYGGIAYKVRVDRYLNTDVHRWKTAKEAWKAIAKALPEFVVGHHSDGVMPMFKTHFKLDGAPYSFSDDEIRNTFHGKASPDTISRTLWLAMHCGLILGPSPMRQPGTIAFAPRSPQDFAHDCLGTDCSGFVNLFHGRKDGQWLIKKYDTMPMARRLDATAIRPGDVLVAASYHHIAIVESVQRAPLLPKHIAKHGMVQRADLLPKPVALAASVQRAEPSPDEAWKVCIVESYGHDGEGVTMGHPRTIRLESTSERKFIQVRSPHEKKDPAHYYFVPPIGQGNPVP